MFIGVLAAIALSLSTLHTTEAVQTLGDHSSASISQAVDYSSLKLLEL